MITNGYQNANYWPIYYWMDYYWPGASAPSTITSTPIYESIGMIRGLFNKDVTIYNVTESVSTLTGENIKTNSTGMTIRARVVPTTASEIFRANKNNCELIQKLYTDMSTQFNEGDRVMYDGNTYEITGCKNFDEWNRYLRVDYKRVK
jgi:SPP1 family predicted phage head-tail adaptor